jgi:hypothetical protein
MRTHVDPAVTEGVGQANEFSRRVSSFREQCRTTPIAVLIQMLEDVVMEYWNTRRPNSIWNTRHVAYFVRNYFDLNGKASHHAVLADLLGDMMLVHILDEGANYENIVRLQTVWNSKSHLSIPRLYELYGYGLWERSDTRQFIEALVLHLHLTPGPVRSAALTWR